MPGLDETRKLAAIFSADIVGYSRLCEENATGTIERLRALHFELVEPLVKRFRVGRCKIKEGDKILAEFPSAMDAVQAALEIQRQISARNANLPTKQRMELRIGINVGEVLTSGSDLYGHDVNLAARIESLAAPGGIVISEETYRQVGNRIAAKFVHMGKKALKNIKKPVSVYRIDVDRVGGNSLSSSSFRPHGSTQGSVGRLRKGNEMAGVSESTDWRSRARELERNLGAVANEIEAKYDRINERFLEITQEKFLFTQKIAHFTSVERAMALRYGNDPPPRIGEYRARVLEKLHPARIETLNEICNHMEHLFSDLKQTEVCVNVKALVEAFIKREMSYVTIARSSNTPDERNNMHLKNGEYVSYPMSGHYALARFTGPSFLEDHVFIPSVNAVLDEIKREDLEFDFPQGRSTRFFSSALIVPVWHDVLEGLFPGVFSTVLGRLRYTSLDIKQHDRPSRLFGFLTVDAKKEGVFNDSHDLRIMKECALEIFDVMFEHFSIKSSFKLPFNRGVYESNKISKKPNTRSKKQSQRH